MPPQKADEQRARSAAEAVTLVVTNLIKLGGLVVALNEALAEPTLRPGALGLAALMMAGAQASETFFTSFFGTGKR